MECGRCGKFFSSLDYLFDDWPEPDEAPPIPDDPNNPFHLSHGFQGEHGESDENTDADNATNNKPDPAQQELLPPRNYQWLWNSLLILVIPLTLANFAWQYRDQLLQNPSLRSIAEGLNLVAPVTLREKRDLDRFQLLSRDMHRHPAQANALILSLTLVNRADYRQDFPDLEITLLDTNQQPIARRRLQPQQYLPEKRNPLAGLAPDTLLPVVVEFSDPGATASGFEIKFL